MSAASKRKKNFQDTYEFGQDLVGRWAEEKSWLLAN